MDAICVIAAPRTGGRHLSEVLRNVPDLASWLDVFDPASGRSGIEAGVWPLLRRLTGIDFDTIRDPALTAWLRAHPGAWLDALAQAASQQGKRQFAFRLLSGQLEREVIEQELIPRPGLHTLLLMRKQIDAYVSLRKAEQTGRDEGLDTTDIAAELDATALAAWLDVQEPWYALWRDGLARRFLPCPILRYELDIDQPPERMLRRVAAAAAQLGVTIRVPPTLEHKGLTRQDRTPRVADKIGNWAEFNRAVFALGIERRAFGYPL